MMDTSIISTRVASIVTWTRPSSFFNFTKIIRNMPLLKRRVTTSNPHHNNVQSHLPLTQHTVHTTATSENHVHHANAKKSRKSIGRLIGRVMIKFVLLILCLIIIVILGFFLYAYGMGKYNARNAKDPCFVAENSMHTLKLLKKSGRQLLSSERNRTIIHGKHKNSILVQGLANDEFKPHLPKIIHQQWKDQNVPKKFQKWQKKWHEYFPENEYTYMLWDDESGRKFIEEYYHWFLPTYDEYKHNINRVDATRYFVLHHFGGIYADLDYEPTTYFYNYLPTNMVGIIESPYFWNEKTQNALMSSPKADPFWIDVFEKLLQNAGKENILEITGPILMDQAIDSSPNPVYILPCENFQRVPLGEFTETLHSVVAEREVIFRLQPLHGKHCGFYSDNRCHFGKHHNTVSYVRSANNGGGIL